jgi:hypothetical protein
LASSVAAGKLWRLAICMWQVASCVPLVSSVAGGKLWPWASYVAVGKLCGSMLCEMYVLAKYGSGVFPI